MEISASSEKSSPEMRRLLGKFTEMPLLVKFFHLSTLMSIDEAKEEFRDMLGSLPVELVNTTNVRKLGSLLQGAVKEDKKNFARILLEFGADPNRANVFCDKTPIEISMGGLMCQSYYGHNFEMLMLLAGFVKADTPGSVKLKILENILERYFDEGNCAEEFKTNLVGLSVSEVMEKRLKMSWHLADNQISVNWLQFTAGEGKTEYLQLLLDHGLEPEWHPEGTPRAVELAAVNGHVDAFSLLAARLPMENNEWFQLGQLLLLAVTGKDEEFKELLARVPVDKVSKEAVCRSTLLQDLARLGKTSAVTALLQHGVDPEGTTDQNRQAPEILAWKNHHLRVLVELNKFMELQPCIMESPLGKQVLRKEERAWRKEMEEKQESCHQEMVALLNQIISLLARDSAKTEEGIFNNANLFNLTVFVSAAFVFGFLACWLFTTNFH